MESITKRAYAKINLGLDVLGKRQDGYHEVSMIMQSVNLYDTLTIRKYNGGDIRLKANLPWLPTDHRNLVYKAAKLFQETLHINEGIQITLNKKIPVSAGMAGGSSDAAATLTGLNQLFEGGLSDDKLKEMGVKLGADVPYCIQLGTALSEGIGERLTPLRPMPNCHILLVKPDISVSTKYVYEHLNLSGDVTHPDIPGMLAAIEKGNLRQLTLLMDNILQTVTIKEYPIIEEIKTKMREQGALTALMSGSGPTVFGIYDSLPAAKAAYHYFLNSGHGKTVHLTRPYRP
jgi:4-diphosphocytidyl-2-C-methyl-D-erythritol kinase